MQVKRNIFSIKGWTAFADLPVVPIGRSCVSRLRLCAKQISSRSGRVGKAKCAHHQEAQSVIDGGHVADAPLPTLATALVIVNGISSRYEGIAMRISTRYVLLMIRSFKGKFAEPILQGRMIPKGFPANLAKVARRKLIMVELRRLSRGPQPASRQPA